MQKIKVLFLAESLNVGGAEKALVSILQRLDYAAFDVTLMLISASGAFMDEVRGIRGLKIKHIVKPVESKSDSLVNAVKIKSIYKLLPSRIVGNRLCRGYDVVVPFCEGYLTKWVAASTMKCKKIAWVHTDMVNNDWPVNTGVFRAFSYEQSAYHKFDHIVAVSEMVACGMRERFECDSVSVIYNILDRDIIAKSREDIPHMSDCSLNLACVGRLEYVKGFDRMIDVMDTLVNQRKLDVSLTLVGDGSQRNGLESKVAQLGLDKNVLFVGSQSNPYPYVAMSDVFICPSRQEGFNIAILEAMTLGKAVIATDSAGPAEILGNGKYGMLVGNSVQGLVDGISHIWDSRDELVSYARLSKQRSCDFGADVQMQKIQSMLYE